MTLHLVITNEVLEAALYETGPRLVVEDYHNMIAAVAELEAKLGKKAALTGIVVEIGPVSFTRHRQTIALVNALAALRNIPALAIEYTEDAPTKEVLENTIAALVTTVPGKPLVPRYRAEPTITLRPAPLQKVEAEREQGKPQK